MGRKLRLQMEKPMLLQKKETTIPHLSANGAAIASDVGYNGVAMRVYIWLEGTDAGCVNTNGEADDMSTYSVVLTFSWRSKII